MMRVRAKSGWKTGDNYISITDLQKYLCKEGMAYLMRAVQTDDLMEGEKMLGAAMGLENLAIDLDGVNSWVK